MSPWADIPTEQSGEDISIDHQEDQARTLSLSSRNVRLTVQ
jgi:hypothetical protein